MSVQIRIQDNRKEIKEHGDYAFPVNVCVETIQQYEQGSFLWHWHPEIELTWIMSGEMEYRVNDSVYYLKEGEGLFGNSNTLHSGYQVDGKNCSYLSVTFHPRFLYGYESGVLQTVFSPQQNAGYQLSAHTADCCDVNRPGQRVQTVGDCKFGFIVQAVQGEQTPGFRERIGADIGYDHPSAYALIQQITG